MATVAELRKTLKAAGIEFDPKAKKKELEALLPAPDDAPEDGSAAIEDSPDVAAEGPADLSAAAPAPEQDPEIAKGDPVLIGNLVHNGQVIPAGSAPPKLTDDEVERLTRLGVLGVAE